MAVSNWKTVAASIAAALTLTASLAAALYQARMASEQVAVLHQQTLITQYTTNAQMLPGMSRLLLKFVQQALLIEQATQPWPAVQGRG